MTIAPRSPITRRLASGLALVALSAAAILGLARCNLTTDKVTGVDVNSQGPGSCVSDCAHQANEAMKDEQDLHKANVQACEGDPVCLANEEARHEAAVAAIQAGRKQCMNSCHEQGSGKSGR